MEGRVGGGSPARTDGVWHLVSVSWGGPDDESYIEGDVGIKDFWVSDSCNWLALIAFERNVSWRGIRK